MFIATEVYRRVSLLLERNPPVEVRGVRKGGFAPTERGAQ
jgi:hypothetical protein